MTTWRKYIVAFLPRNGSDEPGPDGKDGELVDDNGVDFELVDDNGVDYMLIQD